jgi:hypothetical protein
VLTKRKDGDFAPSRPCPRAVFEVCPPSACNLVSLFGGLGQELHDDPRQWLWNHRSDLVGQRRKLGDMAVDEFKDVIGLEGRAAGEELIKTLAAGHASSDSVAQQLLEGFSIP